MYKAYIFDRHSEQYLRPPILMKVVERPIHPAGYEHFDRLDVQFKWNADWTPRTRVRTGTLARARPCPGNFFTFTPVELEEILPSMAVPAAIAVDPVFQGHYPSLFDHVPDSYRDRFKFVMTAEDDFFLDGETCMLIASKLFMSLSRARRDIAAFKHEAAARIFRGRSLPAAAALLIENMIERRNFPGFVCH